MSTEQYFTVTHPLSVNIIPIRSGFVLPDDETLEAEIPEAFRIASQIAQVDLGKSRIMRHGGDDLQELIEIINLQSRKIDLLMGFVLAQQDDPKRRFHTLRFGAGELLFKAPLELALKNGQYLRMKVFLPEESAAIYCYGQVSALKAQTGHQIVLVHFAKIRELDRELLIRASLHIQSKQLKLRAEQRQQQQLE